MSVCLESSSTLANQASSEKSENNKNSIVSTYPDEKVPSNVAPSDASSNRNATKPLLLSSSTTTTTATTTVAAGSTLSSILQKAVTGGSTATVSPNNSLITVMNTQGPVAIVKSLNSPFPTNHHFTLVSSSPLTVTNGLGKQITVVPNPPYTLVRPQTNETVPMTVVQSSTTTVTEVAPKRTETTVTINCSDVSVPATVNNGSVVTAIPITTVTPTNASGTSIIVEKPAIHNVFVKNSGGLSETSVANPAPPTGFGTSGTVGGIPQAQKLLTATSFPPNNVLQNLNAPALLKTGTISKSIVQQQNSNKLKILSNVVVPTSGGIPTGSINATLNTNNPNFVVNKTAAPVKYYHQQKVVTNANGTTKLLGKPSMSTVMKTSGGISNMPNKTLPQPPPLGGLKPPKVMYPAQKGHIKTLPPLNNNNNNALKQNVGLKTIPPQYKGGNICGSGSGGIPSQQVQRTSSGLRTIPPQRSPKGMGSINIAGSQLNKPNYIGKHAIQGQKLRSPPIGGGMGSHKTKANLKSIPSYNAPSDYAKISVAAAAGVSSQSNQQMVYTQALTAQIIETLNQNNTTSGPYSCATGNLSGSGSAIGSRSRDASLRYDGNYTYSNSAPPEASETVSRISPRIMDQKPQSGLDTLSLICQAVLLDHNYNATLPLEPVARPTSCSSTSPLQINGAPNGSLYSPGSGTRGRSSLASSNSTSVMSTSSSTLVPSMSSSGPLQDDDVASDISCGSERRPETEGEETDTAPEAEAVTSNDIDHYGDYVNRCVCGFDHDDGYMIECDRCKVWQHVRCVVKTKKVPDDFLCEICDPTKVVDRAKAQLLQQQYLKDRGDPRFQKDLRLQQKLKETVSDSDSSDGEPSSAHGNSTMSKGRGFTSRKRDMHKNNIHPRRDRTARRPIKKERKMTKRKTKAQSRQHPNQQQLHHHNSEDEKSTAGTIAAAADTWPSSQLPQLRQWIENYEEAVTNHYSPELRARVSNIRINGAHSDLTAQFDCSVHKCRVQTQPLTGLKLLVSTATMGPNTPIIELRGKYMLSTQHRSSAPHHGSGALNTRQHSQRPGPFLFFYRLHKDNTEVCVDTRTYGNDARFVRRSCKPNSELRHCIEKGVLHLYIVTIANVDKNMELTIKHESHDLAVVGTTYIACACGKPDECTVNKSGAPSSAVVTSGTTLRRNGENTNESTNHRKRRGRRTVSSASEHDHSFSAPAVTVPSTKIKEEKPPLPSPPAHVKVEEDSKLTKEEKKSALLSDDVVKVKTEDIKQEPSFENEHSINEKEKVEVKQEDTDEEEDDKETHNNNYSSSVTTRRSSAHHNQQQHHNKSESSEEKTPSKEQQAKEDKKKLSREERKLEAIMKAFERMEKQQQRKQEHQAKQAAAHHRRESDPVPPSARDDEKSTGSMSEHHQQQKMKRRRRKGRARTTSTNSQSHSQQRRSNRVNSADSSYVTSSDETTQMLLSPNSDNNNSHSSQVNLKESLSSPDKAAGLLLALANGDSSHRNEPKSPIRDADSSSNSVHSSPETPLSSACLLVAAAVEPLEPGFKFPKTKKGLMNEWLNKSPECIQSASSISPSSLTPHITTPPECSFYENAASFYGSAKLVAFSQAASYCDNSQPHGNAKKRWLRQAISESPMGGESPPLSEAVAPPKKRKLPRESLSNDTSPPTTPTSISAPVSLGSSDSQMADQEGRVEIVLSGTDEDSPPTVLESDAVLKKRAAEMQQEFGNCVRLPESQDGSTSPLKVSTITSANNARLCSMDPRLSRHIFNNSDHLVGTVEKTLSIFGFQDRKPEPILPTKRKLSITEYRQRKKLTVNEKAEDEKDNAKSKEEDGSTTSTTYTSVPSMRQRSDSTSSATSFMSSDEELHMNELPQKPLSAFNSEPTELEKTRESVSLRLKKAFGLSVDEDSRKTTLNVEALLNCDLSLPSKTTVPLASPTFPIPGSGDTTSICTFPIHSSSFHSTEPSVIVDAPLPPADDAMEEASVQPPPPPPPSSPPPAQSASPKSEQALNVGEEMETTDDSSVPDASDVVKAEDVTTNEKLEVEKNEETEQKQPDNNDDAEIKPEMFYTPDDEEEIKTQEGEEEKPEQERKTMDEEIMEVSQSAEDDVMIPKMEKYEEMESTNYIPPFNNPLYPNSSTFSFGSVIDDDAPYEGRNPSPPPELSSNGVTGSYSVP